MPLCSRNTSGFLGKLTLFMSIFHVPSKALWAAASIGINRAPNVRKKNIFFMTHLHWFEPGFPFLPLGYDPIYTRCLARFTYVISKWWTVGLKTLFAAASAPQNVVAGA